MQILFLHPNSPDYVGESIFHGLRSVLGENCVDIPRMDCMYDDFKIQGNLKLKHNNGFTLYGLLKDTVELRNKRYFWQFEVNKYDYIVISNIWLMDAAFVQLIHQNLRKKLIIIDGHDSNNNFPFLNATWYLKTNPSIFLHSLKDVKYFKRELFRNEKINKITDLFSNIFKPEQVYPISYSIPKEKITKLSIREKKKQFVNYIVDKEVAIKHNEFYSKTGGHQHLFTNEAEYYDDIQKSWFGPTTKRAGWDCLRHYEYAANGCILCFKDLDSKPETCAPHGLNEENCIVYSNYDDLMEKINTCNREELLLKTYQWIETHTTENEAIKMLEIIKMK